MGSFYVNFTTHGSDQATIAESLRSAKRRAFVGPTLAGLTIFCDEKSDSQDDSEIKLVGETVCKDVKAAVLAVLNHDDDILAYWLFDNGKLVDEYNSCPGYFDDGEDTPSGGNAEKLCAAFAATDKVKEVDEVLHSKEYLFAMERHMALAALLNMPPAYALMGYRYLANGELPEGEGDLIRIP